MENNRNLVIAIVLSALILAGFQYLYIKPQQENYREQVMAEKKAEPAKPDNSSDNAPLRDRKEIIASTQRVPIETPELIGSVALKGARLDDLTLARYRETIDPSSPQIVLLSPAGTAPPHQAYYAEFSWLAAEPGTALPTAETMWKAEGKKIGLNEPVKLTWDNGQGLVFERTIAIDEHFLFTVTDQVMNKGNKETALYPFGLVRRHGMPVINSSYIHEGPLGVLDGTLAETPYSKLVEERAEKRNSNGGWLGITDKYWLVALVPPQSEKIATEFSYTNNTKLDASHGDFQSDFRGDAIKLAPGASVQHVTRLFAGAKPLALLEDYASKYKIPHFERAINFGWFYWLAEPFVYLLDRLANWFGSFALAILSFTVLLKILTLPLSLKSFRGMAKMKALQPELKKIQERFADDKAKQGAEMMELYKREKVNPLSGCFPIVVQIPIFFALYKVLFVGIEMRQAPFYGWIKDLSMPDPTSVLTLFGLFPGVGESVHHTLTYLQTAPSAVGLFGLVPAVLGGLMHLGAWPIFMGISMFLQQKLSPQPPDQTQARIFMFMPIVFTFMLAQMPAGLVIYWTWSNLLSIAQQWFVIVRSDKTGKY